jgi:hypothetical protein
MLLSYPWPFFFNTNEGVKGSARTSRLGPKPPVSSNRTQVPVTEEGEDTIQISIDAA